MYQASGLGDALGVARVPCRTMRHSFASSWCVLLAWLPGCHLTKIGGQIRVSHRDLTAAERKSRLA